MERTQIYLTQEQKEALATLSHEKGTPMAELIRSAVDEFLIRHHRDSRRQVILETFGAIPEWNINGETYTREIRAGWGKRLQAADEEGTY